MPLGYGGEAAPDLEAIRDRHPELLITGWVLWKPSSPTGGGPAAFLRWEWHVCYQSLSRARGHEISCMSRQAGFQTTYQDAIVLFSQLIPKDTQRRGTLLHLT